LGEDPGKLRLKFWGVRGSIPSPGPQTAAFGGNTACVSVHLGEDNILVLDGGRLVEQGTHGELLATEGLYASLWNRQRQAEKAREELAEALAQDGLRITHGRLTGAAASLPSGSRVGAEDSQERLPSAT